MGQSWSNTRTRSAEQDPAATFGKEVLPTSPETTPAQPATPTPPPPAVAPVARAAPTAQNSGLRIGLDGSQQGYK